MESCQSIDDASARGFIGYDMKTTEKNLGRIADYVRGRSEDTFDVPYRWFIESFGLTEDFQHDYMVYRDFIGYLSFGIEFLPDITGRAFESLRITKLKRPNQSPEPTVMLVTPRAGARVAPSTTVAHL